MQFGKLALCSVTNIVRILRIARVVRYLKSHVFSPPVLGTLRYHTTVDGYGWTGLGDLGQGTAFNHHRSTTVRCWRLVRSIIFSLFRRFLPPTTLTKLLSNNFEP